MKDLPEVPVSISTRWALKFGCERAWDHAGFWVRAMLLCGGVGFLGSLAQRYVDPLQKMPPKEQVAWGLVLLVFTLATATLSMLLTLGVTRAGIKAAEGLEPSLADLLGGGVDVFGFAMAGFLYAFAIGVGTVLFVVPGAIWTAQFLFATHFVADRRMGPIEAMTASSAITKGVKWELLVFSTVVGLMNVGGALLFGLGLLFTVPVSAIAAGAVYRQLCQAAGMDRAAGTPGPRAPVPTITRARSSLGLPTE